MGTENLHYCVLPFNGSGAHPAEPLSTIAYAPHMFRLQAGESGTGNTAAGTAGASSVKTSKTTFYASFLRCDLCKVTGMSLYKE
jgi:hypothetical protein